MKKFQLSVNALTQALVASLTPTQNTATTATTTENARRGGGDRIVCFSADGSSSHEPPCKPGERPVRVNSRGEKAE
ncbi:hypothetical protein [Brasilonema sp. UFV-L1]|uniref:hypothetical protein n=1 Tax=Brasilonema sp. UFV-L1 TaxID=2234130 RepID=UPI00145EED28|nr:hypothetical protein [Brasilonema sp. UFV-L1]NMG09342.1 hypothetical protein [Brasilonema sp. UFV-L1]